MHVTTKVGAQTTWAWWRRWSACLVARTRQDGMSCTYVRAALLVHPPINRRMSVEVGRCEMTTMPCANLDW